MSASESAWESGAGPVVESGILRKIAQGARDDLGPPPQGAVNAGGFMCCFGKGKAAESTSSKTVPVVGIAITGIECSTVAMLLEKLEIEVAYMEASREVERQGSKSVRMRKEVDLEEFHMLAEIISKNKSQSGEIIDAFQLLDWNDNGKIHASLAFVVLERWQSSMKARDEQDGATEGDQADPNNDNDDNDNDIENWGNLAADDVATSAWK
eukprot:g2069.t1